MSFVLTTAVDGLNLAARRILSTTEFGARPISEPICFQWLTDRQRTKISQRSRRWQSLQSLRRLVAERIATYLPRVQKLIGQRN